MQNFYSICLLLQYLEESLENFSPIGQIFSLQGLYFGTTNNYEFSKVQNIDFLNFLLYSLFCILSIKLKKCSILKYVTATNDKWIDIICWIDFIKAEKRHNVILNIMSYMRAIIYEKYVSKIQTKALNFSIIIRVFPL